MNEFEASRAAAAFAFGTGEAVGYTDCDLVIEIFEGIEAMVIPTDVEWIQPEPSVGITGGWTRHEVHGIIRIRQTDGPDSEVVGPVILATHLPPDVMKDAEEALEEWVRECESRGDRAW
jgi:hypothetical protein